MSSIFLFLISCHFSSLRTRELFTCLLFDSFFLFSPPPATFCRYWRIAADLLDAAVDATAVAVLRAARGAAQTDTGAVDRAVEAVAARVGQLGQLARRPQTGQLHQYYLAAVVLLVAGFVLIVAVR